MWIIGLIVILGLGGFLALVLTKEDKIKCPKCGCEFMYDPTKVIDYTYSGDKIYSQECPNCGEYVKVK